MVESSLLINVYQGPRRLGIVEARRGRILILDQERLAATAGGSVSSIL